MAGDVTNEESLAKIVEATMKKFGSIDILINNAGFGYFVECDKFDMETFRRMMDVNLFGIAALTKLVVPAMKGRKAGLIINLVSSSGKFVFALGEFYAATKFAVMGYSEGIRKELKEHGIKVCTICPGMVKTKFFSGQELERRARLNSGKMPNMLSVGDVTRIISLLCSQSEGCDIQDVTLFPF